MPYFPPASGGGAPTDATYITQTANGSLSAEQALAALATGIAKVTTTTGAVTSLAETLFTMYADARFKIGTLTRDQTASGADVGYTGVGFTPKAGFFVAAVSGTIGGSVGFSDGTSHYVQARSTVTNTPLMFSDFCIETLDNASWNQKASVKSWDADGFTLTWSEGGTAPAGTITVYYIVFR